MSDTTTLYDANGNPIEVPSAALQPPEPPNVRQMRERIKELEKEANRAKELEAQFVEVQQAQAIQAAGLQLDDVRRAAFGAAHKGDWTPEAVQQTAVALGWATPPPPTTPPADQVTYQQMQAAFNGGAQIPPDPGAELDARLATARTEQEFLDMYRQSGRPIAD